MYNTELSDYAQQRMTQLGQAGGMGAMYGDVTCGLGQQGNDISRQLGQQQQLYGGANALNDAQRSWLYDAMSRDSIRQACGPTFDYHYRSDTHISDWSKSPPSPEVRLDEKFPCLAQARRKRVRMKKLIITAILSILGTGSLAMYGPKVVAWYNAPPIIPATYTVRFNCPNCLEGMAWTEIPRGNSITGQVVTCNHCGAHLRFNANRARTYDRTTGDCMWDESCLEEATPTGTINGVQQYK